MGNEGVLGDEEVVVEFAKGVGCPHQHVGGVRM